LSLFGAFKKLGSAVVNTALIPVDVAVDAVTGSPGDNTVRRVKKVGADLEDAHEESFDDDDD
jgi:hypothetical protein